MLSLEQTKGKQHDETNRKRKKHNFSQLLVILFLFAFESLVGTKNKTVGKNNVVQLTVPAK